VKRLLSLIFAGVNDLEKRVERGEEEWGAYQEEMQCEGWAERVVAMLLVVVVVVIVVVARMAVVL